MNNEQTQPAPAPIQKVFDPKCTSFTANGTKYYVSTKLSIKRYEEYEKLQPKLTFDLDFSVMFSTLKKAYAALNDRKFADSAVIIHNLMSGIEDIRNEKRIHPALLMAALAINSEGEDPGTYDESAQLKKIEDWRAEGFDIYGFFIFALNTIKGFALEYNEFTAEGAIEKTNMKKN
jgi:hypothetical protein